MAITKLNPGKCRHLFVIKKNSFTSTDLDDLGRDKISSTDHATIKAEIRRLSGQDRILLNQEFGVATHELATWFISGVTPQMWLEGLNGQRFNIVHVDNIEERNSWLYMILNSETS